MSTNFNLEKSMKKLEDIVENLDSNTITLDKSLKLFEDGVKIVKECESHLSETEQKIEVITSSAKNKFDSKPFSNEAE